MKKKNLMLLCLAVFCFWQNDLLAQTSETSVILSGGTLTVTDINGASSNDNIALTVNSGVLTISGLTSPVDVNAGVNQPDATTTTISLSDITAGIVINLEGGTDAVTLSDALTLGGSTNGFEVNDVETYTHAGDLMVSGNVAIQSNNLISITASMESTGGNIDLQADGNINGSGFIDIEANGTLDVNVAGGASSRLINTGIFIVKFSCGVGEFEIPETFFNNINTNLQVMAPDVSIPNSVETALLTLDNSEEDATVIGAATADATTGTFEVTDAEIANVTADKINVLSITVSSLSTMTLESVNLGGTDLELTNGNGGATGPISFVGSSTFEDLTIFSSGGMTQTGAITVNGTTNFQNIAPTSGVDIVLDHSGNSFVGLVHINTPGQGLTLTCASNLSLGTVSVNGTTSITAGTIVISEDTTFTKNGTGTASFNGNIDVTSSSSTGTAFINHNAGTLNFEGPDNDLIGRLAYTGASGTITNFTGTDTRFPFGGPGVSLTFGFLNVTEGEVYFPDSQVNLLNEARLSGATTLVTGFGFLQGGPVIVENNAVITPGGNSTTYNLNTSDLEISSATFAPRIEGDSAGDYDRLNVTGTITLVDATFAPTEGFTGSPDDDEIVLINNDGTDAIIGTFNSLPEGSGVSFGPYTGMISYVGGDGNDVTLLRDTIDPIAVCQDISLAIDLGGVTVTPDMIDNGSSDNVAIVQLLINGQSSIDFTYDDLGSQMVTLTVIDGNGNSDECAATVTLTSGATLPILISEYQPDTTNDPQTIEIKGEPGEGFAGVFVVIEGDTDSGEVGVVKSADSFSGTFDANGLLIASIPNINNPTHTVVLTSSFSGTAGVTDVDGDDDGVAEDLSAFGLILDAVGVGDGGACCPLDELYGTDFGGINLPGIGGIPGAIFREASVGDFYQISVSTGTIYDNAGAVVDASIFDVAPTNSGTFGAINPAILLQTVPDVVGLTQVQAETDIVAANFTVGTISTVISFVVPAGEVMSQNPVGGTSAIPGSAIDLVVAVSDTEDPVINCPSDITVNNDSGKCGAIVDYSVTATDNVGIEYIQNGGFESGDFQNWDTFTQLSFLIVDDGTTNPPGAMPALTPIAGSYDALRYVTSGPNNTTLSQSVEIPVGVQTATLSWLDEISAFNDFAADNYFRAELYDSNDNLVQEVYSTQPGDEKNQFNPPNTRLYDVTSILQNYEGQELVLRFSMTSTHWLSVSLDEVSLVIQATSQLVTQTAGLPSGSLFPVGVTTNTFEVVDGAGNTATCSFDVTVNDTEAPVLSCLDYVVGNDAGDCGADIMVPQPLIGDCGNGASLNFDGENDQINVANGFTSTMDEVTVEARIFIERLSGWHAILNTDAFSAAGDLHFQIRPDKNLSWTVGGNNVSAIFEPNFIPNQWYDIAVVYSTSAQTATCYIDGVLLSTFNFTTANAVGANRPFNIGSWNDERFFDGNIDELRIWNVARSQADIQSTVGTTLVGNETGLIALYTFNEGSPCGDNAGITTVEDLASGSYDGALSNFALGAAGNCQSNFGAPNVQFGYTLVNDFNGTDDASGIYPLGTTTVNWTVTDPYGNTSNCSMNVIVEDREAPSAVCQNVTVQLDASGVANISASDIDNGSSDNCGIASLELKGYILQPEQTANAGDVGVGQTFTAPVTGVLSSMRLLVPTQYNDKDIYFYNSATGSGVSGSIGTPDYTETGAVLNHAGPDQDIWTEVVLSTPFPVIAGNQYSFAFDGSTNVYYNQDDDYAGGSLMVQYDLSSGCCTWGDLAFQLAFDSKSSFGCDDIGDHTIGLSVIDNAGNIAQCTAIVTVEDPNDYCGGCDDITVFENGSWSPSAPTSLSHAIIRDDYLVSLDGLIDACKLTIDSGYLLEIDAGEYVKVEGDIVVNGDLKIHHEANLVQVENTAQVIKNGTIEVDVTTPVLQTRDFMILGSPMTAETRNDVFGSAFLVLEHTPENFIPHPDVTQGGTNFADDNNDFWSIMSAGTIESGEGYIVRPQDSYTDPANESYDFTYTEGTLTNGIVNRTIIYNGPTDNPDGTPNVLSNPYASAISSDDFINANALINEVYFWEHLTPPGTGIPGAGSMNFSMDDISMYNLSGGVAAANDPSGTDTAPNGIISTGQGFGIKAFGAGTASFNNAMRRTTGNSTLRNSEDQEKIWLQLTNVDYDLGSNTLIAFNSNATQGRDPGYDSNRLATVVSLYSHLENGTEQLGIQTREAFHSDIKIPLGFSTLVDATALYSISITHFEGIMMSNTAVYLVDNEKNSIVNLREMDYDFESGKGTFDERFTLLFEQEPVLEIQDFNVNKISVFPNPTKDKVTIISTYPLEQVEVYDISGRMVESKRFDLGEPQELDLSELPSAIYLIRLYSESGMQTQRLIKE
ncbi:MAG: LamG-like jellyroll fold domain-containing protein [Bacteroidota bacterium]